MMYCNFMEHDMRAAVLAIIGLVGLTTIAMTASASPAGAVGREAGAAPYRVEIAQAAALAFVG
jgi:hypothetical protein